ncbi:MAG: bifunctional demethylmenaquinone methyltransferase/2-methoxy-6-polyprenyl-1,4-benzoquinol methylase UbiE [Fimbriimonas sp.]|nr:bifunctional demethylmenaquinone methyltransferase/2-methoxy-6-polyprenyl-1,4-benzoquinol methylase UbiE [Fimbriimonas sp.]
MSKVDEAIWSKEGYQKRSAVQHMFAEIAPTYDRLNSILSLRLHHRWRRIAVSTLKLEEGTAALDLCCGTGDFLMPLRKAVGQTGQVVGVDFCLPMLGLAREKVREPLSLGDACVLPMASSQFDAVSVGWGIRNVPDIDQAHREAVRVLKPGGRFASLDMARPRNKLLRLISELLFNRFVPVLGALFGKGTAYTYLPKSTQRFLSREDLAASMESAGFENVRCKDLFLGNICIHYAQKPGGLTR